MHAFVDVKVYSLRKCMVNRFRFKSTPVITLWLKEKQLPGYKIA